MTEQNNDEDDIIYDEPTVEEERENLIEQHGSLKDAPLSTINHFENYRAALEARHTRAELKQLVANDLDAALFHLNDDYDEIKKNEDWTFHSGEAEDYFSERQLAQLAAMSSSVRRNGFSYKIQADIRQNVITMFQEDYRKKYTVIVREHLEAVKRFLRL